MTLGTLVIWPLSRSDNGTRIPCSDGLARVRAPVWTASGIGHWKRLIKIPDDTYCYYCINNMTCSIHIYYYPFILVSFSGILFTVMSHVNRVTLPDTCYTSSGDTLFMLMNTLHFMYFLFYVFSVNTLLLYMIILCTSCRHVHSDHDPLMLLLLLV